MPADQAGDLAPRVDAATSWEEFAGILGEMSKNEVRDLAVACGLAMTAQEKLRDSRNTMLTKLNDSVFHLA